MSSTSLANDSTTLVENDSTQLHGDIDFRFFSDYFLLDEDFGGTAETDSGLEVQTGQEEPGCKTSVDRRRERNKVLARKTRQRKKFFFESLQKQVHDLAAENEFLRSIVKTKLPIDVSTGILKDCKASYSLPRTVVDQTVFPTSSLEQTDLTLMKAIQAAQRSFVITDPSLPDNPIIFASAGFLDLCKYKMDDVLGRNCRFLQGPKTDPKQVAILREGILAGKDTSVCLLNYRADGTQFYNQIFLAALRNSSHKIINYVGVQVEIDHLPDAAVESVPEAVEDSMLHKRPRLLSSQN